MDDQELLSRFLRRFEGDTTAFDFLDVFIQSTALGAGAGGLAAAGGALGSRLLSSEPVLGAFLPLRALQDHATRGGIYATVAGAALSSGFSE